VATPPPRAVIFDLDGTLIDSALTIAGIVHAMQDARGVPKAAFNDVRTWVSRGADTFIPVALGYPFDDEKRRAADVAEFRRIYRATKPNPDELFPHALATVAALKIEGYRIGICTNKPEPTARLIIDGIGLAPHVDALVGKRDGLPEKPNPAPLRQALAELGAADAVYIGDSEVDAEAAMAARLPFFLVSFGYALGNAGDIACAARIDDFRTLPELLKNRASLRNP
jgi:phosphoglycolate phosphatase